MSALSESIPTGWRPAADRWWPLARLTPALLLVAVGVEMAALVALLPETLQTWWRGRPPADFLLLLNAARDLEPNGLYSPGLSLFLYPLTWLDAEAAYRVYVALGGLAVLSIAYLTQREVGSLEGRLAVALGVVTLPQMHWALRFGHLTPFLAAAALAGFLLARRRPYLAGLCFSVLVLKLQYAPVPALYLLWTRNFRCLAAFVAGGVALETAGFVAAGFDEMGPYLRGLFDLGSDHRDNLVPIQQAWQYAWPGFLISAGLDPNPLVAFDLMALSLVAVALVWMRGDKSVGPAAAALGMLLVSPYSNFYDWGLLVVAGVLLLRADVSWKGLRPAVLVALYVGLMATQRATPWPIDVVGLDPEQISGTRGLYWITPLALAVVCLLALTGQRKTSGRAAADLPKRQEPWPA